MKSLTLGIPNGSLYRPTVDLLDKIGMNIIFNGRSFKAEIKGSELFNKALIVRPQDIPLMVDREIVSCGICGWDCVQESGIQLNKVVELNYSKVTKKAVKIVVFGRDNVLVDNERIIVSSEYPNLARRVFKRAKIDFSYGSTEVKIFAKIYDYGVCVTETGKSLADNGLKVVKTILISPTVCIAKNLLPEIVEFGALLDKNLKGD